MEHTQQQAFFLFGGGINSKLKLIIVHTIFVLALGPIVVQADVGIAPVIERVA